jgi:hypothetical protein
LAIKAASKLFNAIEIPYVLMEWGSFGEPDANNKWYSVPKDKKSSLFLKQKFLKDFFMETDLKHINPQKIILLWKEMAHGHMMYFLERIFNYIRRLYL